jgi:hypothetical protein
MAGLCGPHAGLGARLTQEGSPTHEASRKDHGKLAVLRTDWSAFSQQMALHHMGGQGHRRVMPRIA